MQFLRRMLAGFILGCGLTCLGVGRAEPPVAHDAAWQLSPTDLDSGPAVCAPDRAALLRTGMPNARCNARIEPGERGERVALFTCRNAGWGRTVFRPTGAGAMQVETQGISNGQPFAIDYRARSVASCNGRP